jgi:Zn-dependent protease with chaperone function
MDWFYRDGDRQIGPLSEGAFRELMAASVITSETPVWRSGWSDWRKAGNLSFVGPDPKSAPKFPHYMASDELRHPQELTSLFLSLTFIVACPVVVFLVADESFWAGVGVSLMAIVSLMLGAAINTKIHQNILMGSSVKVTPTHFSDIYNLCREAAERLAMPQPDIYIKQDDALNAYAIGPFKNKTIVVTSKMAAKATHAELQFIIGHELTHIKCNHTFWLSIVGGGPDEGSQGIPGVSALFRMLFLRWSRLAEYTCDRGGYIACNDLDASLGALCKLLVGPELIEGIKLDQIAEQRKAMDDCPSVQWCEWGFADHPFIINRIHAIASYAAKHRATASGR